MEFEGRKIRKERKSNDFMNAGKVLFGFVVLLGGIGAGLYNIVDGFCEMAANDREEEIMYELNEPKDWTEEDED